MENRKKSTAGGGVVLLLVVVVVVVVLLLWCSKYLCVSHEIVEVKLLCFGWLSPSLKLV